MGWQRKLTGMERWLWLFDRAAPMNLVFVAHVAGRFDRDALEAALTTVAEQCPVLTARIAPDARPCFVGTEQRIPVETVRWQPELWRSTAVEETNRRLPARKGPLARVIVVDGDERSELVLTVNQSALDGLSALQLLDQLLSVYGGGALCALTATEVLEPPSPDNLGSRFGALVATLREIPMMRRLTPLTEGRTVPHEHRRTALISVHIPAARSILLAERAREHATSVHGALASALLLSIGSHLRSGRHARRFNVGCATAVDVRRRTGLRPTDLGNLVSRVVSGHAIHYDTLFWDLAVEVTGTIREATARGTALAYARLKESKAIGIDDAHLPRRVRKSERYNRAAAVINNLGFADVYGGYGDVMLDKLDFLTSANAHVGSSLVLSTVTRGDTCALDFTFAEPLLDAALAQEIVDEFLTRLEAAIDGRADQPTARRRDEPLPTAS